MELSYAVVGGAAVAAIFLFAIICSVAFRIVVSTNQTHIVQRAGTTTSYGRGQKSGNTYYRWPAWIPFFGVRVTVLPVSIFDRKLIDYAAYDIDRVPFVIDVVGFFRIFDSNTAAERVKDFSDLEDQLEPILQGAARTILATSPIDDILGSRAVFGEKFTAEVTKDLASWGVEPVKSIELMDIRDADGSKVISNIMAKKKSFIEMESRVAVAANNQTAQTAEIAAKQAVDVRAQEAEQQVGQRTAEKAKQVGIAQQQATQEVAGEQAATATKLMAVRQVEQVRAAEIARDVQVVSAEQAKQVAIVTAEGVKQSTVLAAEGHLSATQLGATGIEAEGAAKATAQKLMLLAPVDAQITLAKEIGGNQGYQEYLVKVRTIEATQAVGTAQAVALEKAEVRIVATASDPAEGLTLAKLGAGVSQALQAFRAVDEAK